MDCLSCHDRTGTYKKFPTGCGHPAYEEKKYGDKVFKPVNLSFVAQNVGRPGRENCGSCHFFGGGSDGVKHGDMDSSLAKPLKALDVHMDEKGLNFSCTDCHKALKHHIIGRHYSDPAPNTHKLAFPKDDGNRIGCESCHSPAPHKKEKLNHHTDKVACQACHIPAFGRGKFTKIWWDWSDAGQFSEDGEPIIKKDEYGNVIYDTKKGTNRWAREVVPEYAWYNGEMTYITILDKVDGKEPVKINQPMGNYQDKNARIFPFKIFRGKQVYDQGKKTLVVPKLFGDKGSGAYWKDFDWVKSAEAGMKAANAPFSGKIGFVETEMYWPISHMIPPKEDAISCQECHSRDGRLAKLSGFYMPGRDKSRLIDLAGWALAIFSLVLVGFHGAFRIFSKKDKKRD